MKISQREARRLKARVIQLEQQDRARRNGWIAEYPGIDIGRILNAESGIVSAIYTATKLDHAVIARVEGSASIRFFAERTPR